MRLLAGLGAIGRGQPHPPQEVLELRVPAQPIEKRTREAEDLERARVVGLFQPGHGLLLVPQAKMDDREALGRDVALMGERLESRHYLQGLPPPAADSIHVTQPGVGPALAATRPGQESLRRPWPVTFPLVREGQRLVHAAEFRIDLQGLLELLDRLVVPAQAY